MGTAVDQKASPPKRQRFSQKGHLRDFSLEMLETLRCCYHSDWHVLRSSPPGEVNGTIVEPQVTARPLFDLCAWANIPRWPAEPMSRVGCVVRNGSWRRL